MSYPFHCDFQVTEEPEGGYSAQAVINNGGIVTQGETLEELMANCQEAVQCHFHDQPIKTTAEIKVTVRMGFA